MNLEHFHYFERGVLTVQALGNWLSWGWKEKNVSIVPKNCKGEPRIIRAKNNESTLHERRLATQRRFVYSTWKHYFRQKKWKMIWKSRWFGLIVAETRIKSIVLDKFWFDSSLHLFFYVGNIEFSLTLSFICAHIKSNSFTVMKWHQGGKSKHIHCSNKKSTRKFTFLSINKLLQKWLNLKIVTKFRCSFGWCHSCVWVSLGVNFINILFWPIDFMFHFSI